MENPNYVVDEDMTASKVLSEMAVMCLQKAAASDTEEEALSWARPGTAMVRKFCIISNRHGVPYAITKSAFDLYVSRCDEIIKVFKED